MGVFCKVFLAYMRKEFTKKEVKWSYCRVYKKNLTSVNEQNITERK